LQSACNIGRAAVTSVSCHSAVFPGPLNPPLTIPVRYCLTTKAKSEEQAVGHVRNVPA
jgi:hypothetical protein